jgi:predicted small lipoprotein YifL
MKTVRIASLLLSLALVGQLAACGNKGDLVKPDKAPAETPATAPAEPAK